MLNCIKIKNVILLTVIYTNAHITYYTVSTHNTIAKPNRIETESEFSFTRAPCPNYDMDSESVVRQRVDSKRVVYSNAKMRGSDYKFL